MGSFIGSVIRKIARSEDPIKEVKKINPNAVVTTTKPKVGPKSAVGASKGGDDVKKVSTMRRRKGRPTQTRLTAPAGDTSAASTYRKTLLGA